MDLLVELAAILALLAYVVGFVVLVVRTPCLQCKRRCGVCLVSWALWPWVFVISLIWPGIFRSEGSGVTWLA